MIISTSLHMKKIFILLTFICMANAAFACASAECMYNHGSFRYDYKGNVMSVNSVTYTPKDTTYFFEVYDKQHRCLVWNHGDLAYRFGVFNGEWKSIEENGTIYQDQLIGVSPTEYTYSEEGKLIEINSPNWKIYYNSDEKEYCSIFYSRPNFISEYKYTYYDQKGNDTAIIVIDRIKNTTHRIKKIYNPKGYLTEVYENDSLTEYYKYDSAGLPITDSCKMNRDISFEREEGDGKITYEYEDGTLSSIARYNAKGNEIYHKYFGRKGYTESFMKYNEKNEMIEEKKNIHNKNGEIIEVEIQISEKDDHSFMRYKHDTLVWIHSEKETRTTNEEIFTIIHGNPKLNPDTTITHTTFDSYGNILSKKEIKNSKLEDQIKYNYTYNKRGKLLSIQSGKSITELPEDIPLGNVTYNKIIYKYDKQNHLQSVTVLNGNTIKITGQYVNDHLVSIKETTDEGTEIIATYTYDSVGNITERIKESKGVKTITKTTFVYYDE